VDNPLPDNPRFHYKRLLLLMTLKLHI